ncbi:hypothetical protein J2046_005624 [Rhizobium petrolearium]|uniref:Transposase n=2 Tax=Neorhizobium TaxID=1525371 RepID=A0ABV0MFC7_9HYPH|nr:hypothetical protein [Neorhizobium petrolearium]MBP1847340.1 hypothetical protein [Neorhizobium petrolearium]MCC2614372.1 hypothetical protein [Neorhizobium petrolearium]WGI72472.1 hypothetical protein QEO92_31755 [Neorhizobium petrolearium]
MFGFIGEQLFAAQSRNAILLEKGRDFASVGIPELVSAEWACSASPQKLASQDRRRFRMFRDAPRADLRWPSGDEAAR